MSLKNTTETYGWLARFFHWTIALLIIGLLAAGLWMTGLEPPLKYQVYGIHKALGIIVLALVLARLAWRFSNPTPALPESTTAMQRLAAHAIHIFLYVAMLVMPLSGWGMSSAGGHPVSIFGLITVPPLIEKDKMLGALLHDVHEYLGYTLIATIVVHIGAALMHHYVMKDNILRRMLKG